MSVILIRAVILYVVITLALKLMGKRQLGELQPSELVVTILISNLASVPVENSDKPMIMGVIPIAAFVCLDVIVSGIMLKSTKIRRFFIGTPRVVISGGKILQKEMKRLRLTVDDLIETMRGQQIFDLSEVSYAIVETTGKINFLPKNDFQAAQKQDVGAKSREKDPPVIVIRDGKRDCAQLKALGLGEGWLRKTLESKNLEERRVFLMTADKNGAVNIIERDGI